MKYKPLGKTGLYVSELCLGAMTFGRGGDAMAQAIGATGEKSAKEMVDRAFDAGINFFDTANMYAYGVSEELLGKAIGKRREKAVIATKVFFPFDKEMNSLGLSRKSLIRELQASLKRLGTDYVDLYQVHSFDATTPLEETLRTLDDLVREGKVRYLGLSNFAAWQIVKAIGISERLGIERFQSVQAYYSLAGRELEYEILPAVRDLGLGVMVWSPLAGGYLSGKYGAESKSSGRRAAFGFPPVDLARGNAIVEVLLAIAKEHDATPARVALAWLLHQQGITSVILGAHTVEQLDDNLRAASLQLSSTDLARLDEVSRPPALYCWQWPIQRGMVMEELFSRR